MGVLKRLVLVAAQEDHSELRTILSLLYFTVPGVIVVGQKRLGGSSLHTPAHNDGRYGVLFILVAALMLGEVFLNVR